MRRSSNLDGDPLIYLFSVYDLKPFISLHNSSLSIPLITAVIFFLKSFSLLREIVHHRKHDQISRNMCTVTIRLKIFIDRLINCAPSVPN